MITYKNPSVGDIIKVKISSINPEIGAFATMPNGRDGLIRLYDVSWSNQEKILLTLSVGDVIDVKVIKQLPDGKLNLSRKEVMPNPRTIEKGMIYTLPIKSIESYGILVHLGDYTALIPKRELNDMDLSVGDKITCVVTDNTYDEKKHRNNIVMSVLELHSHFASTHALNEKTKGIFKRKIQNGNRISAIVAVDEIYEFIVPLKRFIEPFKTQLSNDELSYGDELDFIFEKYNDKKRDVILDMRPIEKKSKQAEIEALLTSLHEGDIVEAIVEKVNDRNAVITIVGTAVSCVIDRDELSPNKVVRASDEVFQGEHIKVAYLGVENDKLNFSRRFFVKDKYNETLYDLSLSNLLETMDLKTNRFIGKLIEMNSNYFLSELISTGSEDEEQNGKLLTDPFNGKNIIVIIDNRLRNFFTVGNYYDVELNLARKEYRKEQGTPYLFSVISNNIKEVENPYKESVSLSFKQHTSPNTNTSVANLLEEVGQNLYTSKKRMFFELLQNADDAAPTNGVQVKVHFYDVFFLLTHDGYSFSRHDFESITSAAKSTKSANKKKTGYKGIGFKSVFTNSESVFIKSGGYNFSFDKNLPIYRDFKEFYFVVNDIEDDEVKQAEFLHKYAKYYREFNGVKDIPWQLLPVWYDSYTQYNVNFLVKQRENVAIALKMDEETLTEYYNAIREVFAEPRFMLFLRNTNRVQLLDKGQCLTIQKNVNNESNIVSLVNSFSNNHFKEDFSIYTIDNIIVDDSQFAKAGVLLKRKERINNRGEKENYFVRLDDDGNEQNEVPGIPDRIASTTETSLSFALRLNDEGLIVPTEKDELSLYAYLPMNEYRFKFPFFLNADFIPKSDREGISDNPWNYFLFYTIGKGIVKMVSEIGSKHESKYLRLLPTQTMSTDTNDTRLLTEAFNRGYKEALSEIDFIINDLGVKVNASQIIVDKSGLAECIGNESFYSIIGTDKHLPYKDIDSDVLFRDIFCVECITTVDVVDVLSNDINSVNIWLDSVSNECRDNFYKWVVENKECHDLIEDIHTFKFNSNWYSVNEIKIKDKQIISTKTYAPILHILAELGFCCSENIFEDHPLKDLLSTYIQTDKELFVEIQKQNISVLSFDKRLLLFKTAALFDGVADATLKSWPLFKNLKEEYTELNKMLPYDDTAPNWLDKYILCEEESCDYLLKYVEKAENAYSSIIVPNIDDILKNVGIWEIYQKYHDDWKPLFTNSLIKKQTQNIISVVEQSDISIKSEYIKSVDTVNIDSNKVYNSSDEIFRILKLALSDDSLIPSIKLKIKIDNLPLSAFIIKDEFSIQIGLSKFVFYLSSLVPDYETTSKLTKVLENFELLPSMNKLFELREITNYIWVKNNLITYLSSENFPLLSPEQFAFFICYEKKNNKSYFEPDIKPHIKINDKELFLKILDYCYITGMGEILRTYITVSGIEYPFERIYGTYFDCGVFAMPREQTPEYISKWAETKEKKDFLISIGLHDLASDEMVRRQAFYNSEEKGNWTITTRSIIENLLEWVKASMNLPFSDDYHRNILMPLMSKIGCSKRYDEKDVNSAKEWNDDRYKDWKSEKQLRIFIYENKIPYSCSWGDSVFYTGAEEDFIYFSDTNHLYINGTVDAASVLSNVYPVRGIPFEKDDWHQLFFVSRDSITQYSNENESLRNKIAELEEQLNLFRAAEHSGKEVTERGNVASIDQEAINREARIIAKSMLKRHGYDVSDWDPITSLPDVVSIIKTPEGEPINVVIRSAKGRKIHLAATSFEVLMSNPNNLLVVRGEDGEIHTVDFQELFGGNSNVNLIFDANFTPLSYFKALGTIFKYVKNTDFVIENPQYSAFDEIKNFGLDVKNEGEVIIGTEKDI